MRKGLTGCVLLFWGLFWIGCGAGPQPDVAFQYQEKPAVKALQKKTIAYPQARFVVLADPHYHHPDLGTSGPAFEAYIESDRKLLAQSDAILDAAIERIRQEPADFVLICGDLTKDGSRRNHEHVAEKIGRLHPSAPVYVVPGNHDVLNGEAYRYTKTGRERIPTVTADEFENIYQSFGYGQALAADPNSLSYVVEPVPGLRLLALDSCLWRKNSPDGHPHVDGRFSADTLRWIENMLIRSKREGKAVLAMMHHGLVEHYPNNEKYYGEYVVDNSEAVAELLARYGVRLVFTGHFHAQDITKKDITKKDITQKEITENQTGAAAPFVLDVETGSLVTYPCPYRSVRIDENQMCHIESRFIRSIAGMEADFQAFARQFAYQGTIGMANEALEGYRVSEAGREKLSPQIADAYLAHLSGDEKKPETVITAKGTGLMGRLVVWSQKDLVEGWWTDLPPPDNSLTIDLETGGWRQ